MNSTSITSKMYLDFTFKVASSSIALHKFTYWQLHQMMAKWSKGIQHGWLWSSDSVLMPGVKSNHSLSPSDIHILKDRNVSKQEGLTIYSTERKLEKSFNLHLQNRTTSLQNHHPIHHQRQAQKIVQKCQPPNGKCIIRRADAFHLTP